MLIVNDEIFKYSVIFYNARLIEAFISGLNLRWKIGLTCRWRH